MVGCLPTDVIAAEAMHQPSVERASARTMLFDLHRSFGRIEGKVDNLSDRVNGHIEDETGLMGKVEMLSTQSHERHAALHHRLDQLEQAGITTRVRWGVVMAIGAGVGTLATTIIGALLTGSLGRLLSLIGSQ